MRAGPRNADEEVMLSFASSARLRGKPRGRAQDRVSLGATIALAVAGLSLTTYDHWHDIGDVALIIATLAVVAAFVRAAVTFGDTRVLAHGRDLLTQNKVILNAAGDGIFGVDADGNVTFANPAAARMTRYRPEEMTGRHLHGLVHHTREDGTPYPADESPVLASLVDRAIHRCDLDVYWRSDGTQFPVEYTSTPIVDGDRTRGAVVVFRDVTDRREIERVKDQFTSVVSHELRTPLTSIRGSLGLLESGVLGPLPDKGRRMIQIAVENTDRLVRLINDILDLERSNSGALALRPAPCEAADLIALAADAVLPMAVEADVTLAIHADIAPFAADADRVIQTLTNLMSNAVKFSPPGSTVTIASERRDGEILFRVSDCGRGIPADRIETIFERFQQVDASDSREKGGTGLGLAICRSVVDLHGGRIWAQSVPGEGSTFSFVLPAGPAEPERPDFQPRVYSGGGPVLVVCEDDAAILEVTSTALEERGYHVLPASSGEHAIALALAERPDAILLDLVMPGMTGWETIRELQACHETQDIPIVVLSVLPRAFGALPPGVVEWIEKPALDGALFSALERAVGSPARALEPIA